MPGLKIRELSFSYDGTKILKNINLDFKEGEKTFILGGNGEGKTTLLEHLNGLLQPNTGDIYFGDQKITYDDSCLNKLRQEIGVLFQNPENQIVAPKVPQDIGVGPCNLGLTQEQVKNRINNSLKKLDIKELAERKTHNLSVGEKKKVCIAGLLAMKPSTLVLDEPLSSLDPKSSREVIDIIQNLNQEEGKTIIIATHNIGFASKIADKVIIMEEGKVKESGSPENILRKDILNKYSLKPPGLNMNKIHK
ncbi:MAG: Energy-coupling factor transporter ATP-binding protein EcfA2 [Candidatus Methanohalarchaeum thermophilum]|uniref:ABC transporter ATP-binding protein n=1 Tax=Methanohalarchaeum thermophilum TaxID=1903181 RepID=A0A1Q6DVJ9_METT1|nr:MAG: Energy-coupling factor transporter ATP-binding protein EcfA2 [Candidatus Methanohalarchaeum thermophilum]